MDDVALTGLRPSPESPAVRSIVADNASQEPTSEGVSAEEIEMRPPPLPLPMFPPDEKYTLAVRQ